MKICRKIFKKLEENDIWFCEDFIFMLFYFQVTQKEPALTNKKKQQINFAFSFFAKTFLM